MRDSGGTSKHNGKNLPAKRSKKTLWSDISDPGEPLTPWQKQFAQYEALHPERKRRTEYERAAKQAAGYPVPSPVLARMRSRPDYREYLHSIKTDAAKLARERVLADVSVYIEAHKKALEELMKLGDWRAVAKFTMPMIQTVVPRRVEQQIQSTRISVTVGKSPTARLLEGVELDVDEAPVVEYEIEEDPEEVKENESQ